MFELTETNAALTTSGTLTSTDVDGTSAFTAETVAGTYGSLVMGANGVWSYTASSAQDQLAAGVKATDTFTVKAADGTASSITVNITGTNDAAVISGTRVFELTETNAVLTTTGTLTSTDVDGVVNAFTAETVAGTYGSLTMGANGTWNYTASSAQDQLAAGVKATDVFTVKAADGTASTITVNITGTNDVASVSSITAPVSEGNDSAALNASGMLVIADADAGEAVVVAKQLAGTYGRFNVSADGTWTYTGSEAHDRLKAGEQVSDSISVTSRDGTASGTITVNITGTNDVPVMTKPNSTYTVNGSAQNYSLTLIQGSAEQTIATATATDVDAVGSLTYSLAPQNGDASADYFSMDANGVIKFLEAAALSSTVDARDDNKDGLMDSPYVIHLVATDSYGGTSLAQTITVNIKMAVAIDGKSAQLPGSSNDWHFAPQAQLVSDELQGDGFKLTNSSNSNIYLNLPSSVDFLNFSDGAVFGLSNNGTVGTIEDLSTGNHSISVADDVTQFARIVVEASGVHSVNGTLDAAPDPFDPESGLKYYRSDALEILDTPFANATFLMVGSDLHIAITGGGTKTLNDIESVVFMDRTVHIVGADGYATFNEAIEQGQFADGHLVYGSKASNINPTSTDLNNLSALAGLTDFYTYNG